MKGRSKHLSTDYRTEYCISSGLYERTVKNKLGKPNLAIRHAELGMKAQRLEHSTLKLSPHFNVDESHRTMPQRTLVIANKWSNDVYIERYKEAL
ncbi:hypothetical protein DOY81_002805 [Sarcophaga bullata]|nr:hypothetical protein DOY81_002805 [Sarcophaga bullata]